MRGPPRTAQTQAIVAHIQEHPTETWSAIGIEYGLSKERIRQIAQRAGLPSHYHPHRRPFYRVCQRCGDARKVRQTTDAQKPYCRRCSLRKAPLHIRCDYCGNVYTLEGQRATYWRRNHKGKPNSRSACPQCVGFRGRPAPPLTLHCAFCGRIYEVSGQRASSYRHSRKRWPALHNTCPSCMATRVAWRSNRRKGA